MRLPDADAEMTGPNLTPVIDVVFLLLIFFLVATRFDQQEVELPAAMEEIALPEVPDPQPMAMPPEHIIVNITREGNYVVHGKVLSEAQLIAMFRKAGDSNPDNQAVVIRAHNESPVKHTARVMHFGNLANLKPRLRATPEGS